MYKRVIDELVIEIWSVVLFARTTLHVAVGIVLYLTDALFLGFLEVLSVGNALAEAVRQPAYKVEVTLRSLNLVLTDFLL